MGKYCFCKFATNANGIKGGALTGIGLEFDWLVVLMDVLLFITRALNGVVCCWFRCKIGVVGVEELAAITLVKLVHALFIFAIRDDEEANVDVDADGDRVAVFAFDIKFLIFIGVCLGLLFIKLAGRLEPATRWELLLLLLLFTIWIVVGMLDEPEPIEDDDVNLLSVALFICWFKIWNCKFAVLKLSVLLLLLIELLLLVFNCFSCWAINTFSLIVW